jgi:hypothetical protein
LCLSSSSALHFSNYSFRVRRPVTRDDGHLFFSAHLLFYFILLIYFSNSHFNKITFFVRTFFLEVFPEVDVKVKLLDGVVAGLDLASGVASALCGLGRGSDGQEDGRDGKEVGGHCRSEVDVAQAF